MSTSDNVIHHPAFGGPPVKNPKTRGRPKGTISLRSERRHKEAAKTMLQKSPYHPSVGSPAPPQPGHFHYPKELLLQRYLCLQGGVWKTPVLSPLELASEKFRSPLGDLLKQLESEGHDVSGARIEYEALRESGARIDDVSTAAMKANLVVAQAVLRTSWPQLGQQVPPDCG
jgi:hypothetical protein